MKPAVLAAFFAATSILAAPAFAQPAKGRPAEGRPMSGMSHEERQRLRQDVDAARGNYDRRDPRRGGRMPPEEREKLRRDVQDANRDMRKK
jgi:uncharacterized membrane protein